MLAHQVLQEVLHLFPGIFATRVPQHTLDELMIALAPPLLHKYFPHRLQAPGSNPDLDAVAALDSSRLRPFFCLLGLAKDRLLWLLPFCTWSLQVPTKTPVNDLLIPSTKRSWECFSSHRERVLAPIPALRRGTSL